MLRIDIRRFPGRDAEELRIELIDPVDEPAPLHDRLARHARFGVVVALDVPAIGRHIAHAFPAVDEEFPERIGGVHAAGETAADSNDGDTFFVHGHELPGRGGLISADGEHVKRSTHQGGE